MTLLPAYFSARRRKMEPIPAERLKDGWPDDMFEPVPPNANENATKPAQPEATSVAPVVTLTPSESPAPSKTELKPEPELKSEAIKPERRPIDLSNLNRLSVDTGSRLYWDGNLVDVHRRVMMSKRQIIGLTLIGLLIAVAALGIAVQGAVTAHDFACKRGWMTSFCPAPPPARPDIPT